MLQTLIVALLPGGQLRARRNAWAAMSEGSQRARARSEAHAALALAVERCAVREALAVERSAVREARASR